MGFESAQSHWGDEMGEHLWKEEMDSERLALWIDLSVHTPSLTIFSL